MMMDLFEWIIHLWMWCPVNTKTAKLDSFFKLIFTNTLGMRYEHGQGFLLQVTVILISFLYSILLKTDRSVKLLNQ